MARRTELDDPATFVIPDNFISKGTLLGGMIKVRNAIEAIICAVGIGYPIYLLPINLTVRLFLIVVFGLGVGILALVGVNKGPLSEYLLDLFKYKRATREYGYISELGAKVTDSKKEEVKSDEQ